MTSIEDGPAKGQTFMLKRAPLLLRVVESDGTWDALDQLDDLPNPWEKIYAYERVGDVGQVHINAGRSAGHGWYTMASYRFVPDQPTDAEMRDPEKWQAWCWKMKGK